MRDVPVKVVRTPREVRERLALLLAPERNPPSHRRSAEFVPDLVNREFGLGAGGGAGVKGCGFVLGLSWKQVGDADADQAEGGAGGFALQEGHGRIVDAGCQQGGIGQGRVAGAELEAGGLEFQHDCLAGQTFSLGAARDFFGQRPEDALQFGAV